jgi:hypothetical protein
VPFYRELIV